MKVTFQRIIIPHIRILLKETYVLIKRRKIYQHLDLQDQQPKKQMQEMDGQKRSLKNAVNVISGKLKLRECSFLQQYFEIDSDDVEKRVMNSFIPLNPNFLEVAQHSPDLYGPFWIYTTLIFVIAAAGSLTKYLNVY